MLVYETSIILIEFDIHLWIEWLPIENKKWADALSRLKLDRFFKLNEIYKLNLYKEPIKCAIKKEFTFIKNKKLKAYYKIN